MAELRARYHELVAEQARRIAEITILVNERSIALIEGRTFSKRREIQDLEYEILALAEAVAVADGLAAAEVVR